MTRPTLTNSQYLSLYMIGFPLYFIIRGLTPAIVGLFAEYDIYHVYFVRLLYVPYILFLVISSMVIKVKSADNE